MSVERTTYPPTWTQQQNLIASRINQRIAHLRHIQKVRKRAHRIADKYPNVSIDLDQWCTNATTRLFMTAAQNAPS
jgi:hypothetical protein